ncbi:MAG: hypothetical protein KAJ54_01715 [Candidatus Aenigmarchaeota archaeon]|nr:hypothetical protein [Candidatus Aenigmarchaeota archaeon]
MSQITEIKKLQEDIKYLVSKINNTHKHEKPELISYMKVIEEVGEITEVLLSNQIKSRKHEKLSKEYIKKPLGDEIADCIIALLSLANDFDIPIEESIDKKMKKHYQRNIDSNKTY